jgi:superfamily II DNA or RNA helicase
MRKGLWQVPFNAVQVVNLLANHWQIEVAGAGWIIPPPSPTTWEAVYTELVQAGEVRPWVLDGFLTQYQKDAIVFGWNHSGVHYWHTTGAGKTLTGMIAALSVPGPVVVVTRAASRIQFAREIDRFLNVRAYVVRPASHPGPTTVQGESYNGWKSRHKGQFTRAEMTAAWTARKEQYGIDAARGIPDYLRDCVLAGTRPFIVVGWEALSDNYKELCALHPGAVILDESHRGKSTKRWTVEHLPELHEDEEEAKAQVTAEVKRAKLDDGFVKDTPDGRKMFTPVINIATSAATLSRSARKRICTTATPVKDRVRDLWAQLDMAEPNAWGNATSWRKRYADMKPGTYGGMDDRGESNIDELNIRKRSVAHILSYAETHKHLPPKRRQSVYVAPEDQARPAAGFAKQLRDAKKRGPTAIVEARLMEAASRKRKVVLSMVEDHVSSGQKIVLFTGRRADCDELGSLIRKIGFVKKNSTQVWAAHGDQSTDFRQEVVDEFMAHPGPCVLVGTGHAFGESLNIDAADAAFFVMLPYTPGQLRQWEGRFHRASTKKPVVIYYVIAEGTVDEHVASILIDKLPAVEAIVEDTELAQSSSILAGFDPNETPEQFAASILADLDL